MVRGAAGAGAGAAGAGAGAAGAGAEACGAAGAGAAPEPPAAGVVVRVAPGRGRCSTIRVTITRRISTFRGAGVACATRTGFGFPSAGSAPARIWNASNAAIAKNSPPTPP